MALTVTSTILDTSWAEVHAVNYTASTLGTLSDIIDQVSDKLNRGTLSSSTKPTVDNIASWIVRGKEEISEIKKFTFGIRHVTATLTAGTYYYSMPPDYDGGVIKLRDITNDNSVPFIASNQFDDLYPDMSAESAGQMLICTVRNMVLWVAPPPDSADVVEMHYTRSGDDITTTDISWMPENLRWKLVDFCMSESFELLGEYDKAMYYRQKLGTGLQRAKRADNKKKWTSMGYRTRSIFQAQ